MSDFWLTDLVISDIPTAIVGFKDNVYKKPIKGQPAEEFKQENAARIIKQAKLLGLLERGGTHGLVKCVQFRENPDGLSLTWRHIGEDHGLSPQV